MKHGVGLSNSQFAADSHVPALLFLQAGRQLVLVEYDTF